MNHAAAHAGPAWTLAVVVAAVLLGAYGGAAAALRSRTGRAWPGHRVACFAGGALVLGTGLSPVVGDLAGSAARAHMAQHVLLGMVAPLGLVLGAPLTLALSVLPVAARRRGAAVLRRRRVRLVVHPLAAGALHVGGLYALYLTPLYAATLTRPGLHAVVLIHFVLAGCLFAWSLVAPEQAARRPGMGWRVGVLIAASAAHGYLAKLLYARAGDLSPGEPHAVSDAQAAAQWMYYAGDVAEVALAVALFAAWYRRAGRSAGGGGRAGPLARRRPDPRLVP